MKRKPRFLLLLGILFGVTQIPLFAQEAATPLPGKITEILFPPVSQPLLLWLPEAHGKNPDRRWPVCLYYHGTNGSPTLRLALEAAGRENWILIGMTYRQSGRFQGSPENLEAEKKVYQELLEQWNTDYTLGLDPQRVFVGGFSKGGWLSGLFLENDPRLAGAIILGAGLLDEPGGTDLPLPVSGKPVYLGLGEKDGNVAMSFGGAEILRKGGAKVTWELWEGIGHSVPAPLPAFLQQWFDLQGVERGSLSVQSDAVEWLEEEWARIQAIESPRDQWLALDTLSLSPWRALADKELDSEMIALQAALAKRQDLVDEREARDRYFQILEAESSNRWVETLRTAHEAYGILAAERSETHWGKRAEIAKDRTAVLLP